MSHSGSEMAPVAVGCAALQVVTAPRLSTKETSAPVAQLPSSLQMPLAGLPSGQFPKLGHSLFVRHLRHMLSAPQMGFAEVQSMACVSARQATQTPFAPHRGVDMLCCLHSMSSDGPEHVRHICEAPQIGESSVHFDESMQVMGRIAPSDGIPPSDARQTPR